MWACDREGRHAWDFVWKGYCPKCGYEAEVQELKDGSILVICNDCQLIAQAYPNGDLDINFFEAPE